MIQPPQPPDRHAYFLGSFFLAPPLDSDLSPLRSVSARSLSNSTSRSLPTPNAWAAAVAYSKASACETFASTRLPSPCTSLNSRGFFESATSMQPCRRYPEGAFVNAVNANPRTYRRRARVFFSSGPAESNRRAARLRVASRRMPPVASTPPGLAEAGTWTNPRSAYLSLSAFAVGSGNNSLLTYSAAGTNCADRVCL